MLQVARDLREEAEELHAFLQTLSAAHWQQPTAFMNWTPWDVVAHLHYYDGVSLLAASDEAAFAEKRAEIVRRIGAGESNAQLARSDFGAWSAAELLPRWLETCRALAGQLGAAEAGRRLPWFGPDMGVRMFTTARLMETWAHGQAIYDLLRAPRQATPRLRNVAAIGVRTYGWTFANRGQKPPGPPPYVCLQGPAGDTWEWNEPSDHNFVRGSALDFCMTVTQVRNVADTQLQVAGESARRWMEIAQCFAGGPVDPPLPGQRVGA